MLFQIAGVTCSWDHSPLPHGIRPFLSDAERAGGPVLRCVTGPISVDPRQLEPAYAHGVFAFAPQGDGSLLAWNRYPDHPERTAVLTLSGGNAHMGVSSQTASSSLLNMLMIALLPMVAHVSGLLLHASLVAYRGRAVAFSAPSGTGKSTHADLWRECFGARILNGDRAFVRRVGPDGVWRGYGSPWAGSSPYICNESAPLAAIVLLEQGPCNRMRRLAGAEALTLLQRNIRLPFWDGDATTHALEVLDLLLREVPLYLLSCRPDAGAAELARSVVFDEG